VLSFWNLVDLMIIVQAVFTFLNTAVGEFVDNALVPWYELFTVLLLRMSFRQLYIITDCLLNDL
jgi:hypothetical protein